MRHHKSLIAVALAIMLAAIFVPASVFAQGTGDGSQLADAIDLSVGSSVEVEI
ncbi:MAG: hypothetical protein IIY88_01635 [Eubacterium sp.]|nr:hypothetical protein [Eubacterium sp.]